MRKVSKKRGEYSKHSAEDRVEIGKYASKHGVAKAVRQFNNKDVKESTVRDWKKLYDSTLKMFEWRVYQRRREGGPHW